MRTIARGDFQGTNDELRAQLEARVAAFRNALADHAKTVGVPAPRDDDLIESLARSGEAFEIEPEPEKPPLPTPEELIAMELEAKRQSALRALQERMLAQAVGEPGAPQEVNDYAAALGASTRQ